MNKAFEVGVGMWGLSKALSGVAKQLDQEHDARNQQRSKAYDQAVNELQNGNNHLLAAKQRLDDYAAVIERKARRVQEYEEMVLAKEQELNELQEALDARSQELDQREALLDNNQDTSYTFSNVGARKEPTFTRRPVKQTSGEFPGYSSSFIL